MSFLSSFATRPIEWAFWCPANERQHTLTEEDILNRLDDAQALLKLPPCAWDILVEIIAPDTGLDAGEPARELGTPTNALPGTEEKIAVMAARLKAGFALTHPQDAAWDDTEEEHTEQVGELLRNGMIRRTRCKVAHRDGASIVVSRDPEEAVEVIRQHFKGADLRELAGLLWEGIGYQSRKRKAPEEGFLVTGKIEVGTRRRKRRRREPAGQLTLFSEESTAVAA